MKGRCLTTSRVGISGRLDKAETVVVHVVEEPQVQAPKKPQTFGPAFRPFSCHGFGIWMLLLVMRQPWMRNKTTMGCTSNMVSANHTPPGRTSWIHPRDTHHAIRASSPNVVGMGVPSKYLALPVTSLGIAVTVTLKRAKRVKPHSTKKARQTWSSGERTPMAKATTAGDTPNEIFSNHVCG
jgi:hypothetical protein